YDSSVHWMSSLLLRSAPENSLALCGQAPLNTKIVGGEDAAPGAWPWQASLHFKSHFYCGGSLINNQWVLSAAHCFPRVITQADVRIYLGRETQELDNANEVSRNVSRIVTHPSYNHETNDNDIALVQLSSAVTFTDYIRPVCLAGAGSEFGAGVIAWVTGWGTMDVGKPLESPGTLQEVDVPIVSNADCDDAYGLITSNMICAGLYEGGKDSCQGDSGGPLVVKNGSQWIECGVVSFGKGCAEARFPGVYARVSEYESWIKSTIPTNQPGFIPIRIVMRPASSPCFASSSSSSSITGVPLFLALSLPLLVFLQEP
uniref:Trypsin-like n=1 Tax=Salarias fasciatus TaxID=181472 RepID=A0A672GN17_SALFA